MARVPDVVRSRFFSRSLLDTFILISSLFGKCGSKFPPQSPHVRRATIFPTENTRRPKKVFIKRGLYVREAAVFLLKSDKDQKKVFTYVEEPCNKVSLIFAL